MLGFLGNVNQLNRLLVQNLGEEEQKGTEQKGNNFKTKNSNSQMLSLSH